MYCAWRIPAHLRCTQCSILLHLMDICFLPCICLWQISQIQTCLFKVVGHGLVSTSPAFVSSSASHPAGPHGRHAKKNGKSGLPCWRREGSTQFAQQLESAVTAPPSKQNHLIYQELDCTTLCNSFIVLFKIIYIYVILIYLLLFSASIGSGELCSSSLFFWHLN